MVEKISINYVISTGVLAVTVPSYLPHFH